jgi:hypothetical protein
MMSTVGIRFDGRAARKECPELGRLIHSAAMPLAVMNEAGKCIDRASISKGDNDSDEEFEAVVIADNLENIEMNFAAVMTYWIMITEWKGEVAEKIGLGVVTTEKLIETQLNVEEC